MQTAVLRNLNYRWLNGLNLVCTKFHLRCVQSKPWGKNSEEYASDPLHEKVLWDVLIAYYVRQRVNPVIAWQWSHCWIVLPPRNIVNPDTSQSIIVSLKEDFFFIVLTHSIMIFFRWMSLWVNTASCPYKHAPNDETSGRNMIILQQRNSAKPCMVVTRSASESERPPAHKAGSRDCRSTAIGLSRAARIELQDYE